MFDGCISKYVQLLASVLSAFASIDLPVPEIILMIYVFEILIYMEIIQCVINPYYILISGYENFIPNFCSNVSIRVLILIFVTKLNKFFVNRFHFVCGELSFFVIYS